MILMMLNEQDFRLPPKNFHFFTRSLKYLRSIFDSHCCRLDPETLRAINDMPPPRAAESSEIWAATAVPIGVI